MWKCHEAERHSWPLVFVLVVAYCFSNSLQAQNTNASSGLKTIAFITDFDIKDDAVGICKAVMNGIAPGVQVIDIRH